MIPRDATMHQFVEGEYLCRPMEYDLIINDPSDFCLRYYITRCAGLEAFRKLMPFRNVMGMATSFLGACLDPEVQEAFQNILDVNREMAKMRSVMMEVSKEAIALGLPSLISGAQAHAPFDIFADTLRGTRGIIWLYASRKTPGSADKITP
jgi:hypothetical protein